MKALRTVALIAGLLAIFFGGWGLLDHQSAGDSEAKLEEGFMWITITMITLGIGVAANALAARQEGRDR